LYFVVGVFVRFRAPRNSTLWLMCEATDVSQYKLSSMLHSGRNASLPQMISEEKMP
jgi:hypothetical protein